jgi:glycosyltransferase involved in cell wall biosynthesis
MTLIDFWSLDDRGIYTDLMREFAKNGHKVYIMSPIERRNKKSTTVIKHDNYQILKIKIGNIQKTNIIEKGISTLTLEKAYVSAIKKYFANVKFDLVLYSTPPITLLKAVNYVKRRDNAKCYLLLKDIFPQNAVDLGMLKTSGLSGILYRYFRKKEKKLYAISDHIGCMSEANVEFVLRNNPEISQDKVEVCPNSIEPYVIDKVDTEIRQIRSKYQIPDGKITFIYGGNLGRPQGIDFIIECLRSNKRRDEAFFIIVGSGTEYHRLEKFLVQEDISNALLIPQLPKNDYEMLALSCDVGLLFLDYRFTIPNFPSRLLSYMNASLPVLAATDKSTDVGKVIEKGQFGLWCESNNVEQFNEKLKQLFNPELRLLMGKNARKYLEEHYTSKKTFDIIMSHFL